MLPWDYSTTYVEPFAGMLGVLLQRKPTVNEIVNDVNGDIHNWWIQVRENPDELSRLIALTPISRKEFKIALAGLDSKKLSPLRRALATQIVLRQSFMHAVDSRGWSPLYATSHTVERWTGEEIAPLCARLYHVQFENRDALEILERTATSKHAVVYCDPPYRGTQTKIYSKENDGTDWQRMHELLDAQQGRVAVSGYGNQWDALGWNRFEFVKGFTVPGRVGKPTGQTRTEVMWCNYEPNTCQQALDI